MLQVTLSEEYSTPFQSYDDIFLPHIVTDKLKIEFLSIYGSNHDGEIAIAEAYIYGHRLVGEKPNIIINDFPVPINPSTERTDFR